MVHKIFLYAAFSANSWWQIRHTGPLIDFRYWNEQTFRFNHPRLNFINIQSPNCPTVFMNIPNNIDEWRERARAYMNVRLCPTISRPPSIQSAERVAARASRLCSGGGGSRVYTLWAELRSSGCKVCSGRPLLRSVVRKVEKYGQCARTCVKSTPLAVLGRFKAQGEPERPFAKWKEREMPVEMLHPDPMPP